MEISLPFGVDDTGGIGAVTDLGMIAQNHVFSAVGTNKGERVMNPEYGANLINHVFEAITDAELGTLQSDISDAIEQFVLEANVTGVDVSEDAPNGIVNVLVHFTLTNDDTEQVVTISTSLPTA